MGGSLDSHRRIGDTVHVCLLVGNDFLFPHQGDTFLCWFATGYISLRNSWDLQERSAEASCDMGEVYPESHDPRGDAAHRTQKDPRTLWTRRSAPALVGY